MGALRRKLKQGKGTEGHKQCYFSSRERSQEANTSRNLNEMRGCCGETVAQEEQEQTLTRREEADGGDWDGMGRGRETDEVRGGARSDCVEPDDHHNCIYFERCMKLARAFEHGSSMS